MPNDRIRKQRAKDDDVVTIGRYAKAIGIGRTTAYVQARAGEIPVKWRGGRFEMTRADFDRLVAEHKLQSEAGRQ